MLMVQALITGYPLVTLDPIFNEYGIRTIW